MGEWGQNARGRREEEGVSLASLLNWLAGSQANNKNRNTMKNAALTLRLHEMGLGPEPV